MYPFGTMSNETALPMQNASTKNNESTPHSLLPTQNESAAGTQDANAAHTRAASSLREVCADMNGRVQRLLSTTPSSEIERRTQEQTRVASSVMAQALTDYDFDTLSLSYNGGKDCLVLLILYLSVLHTHFSQPSGRRKKEDGQSNTSDSTFDFPTSIPSVYAKPPDPFDLVSTFVDSSTRDYHLDLIHISTNPGSKPNSKSHSSPPPTTGHHTPTIAATIATNTTAKTQQADQISASESKGTATTNGQVHNAAPVNTDDTAITKASIYRPVVSFRDAFALYLHMHPQVRAIFVGTRRTDPHGATLDHFQMTDGNWPRFMRIHPVIDWRLSEIWCFLRSEYLADPKTGRKLEYCQMYDEGYTSLGGVGDTLRNPRLRYTDQDGVERYRPAYEMTEDEKERAGRE